MDENRERYRECVVQPFRQFLEDLSPAVLQMDGEFDVCGRTGANFSRINRDIRFAKDKTLYKPQMYLKFQRQSAGRPRNRPALHRAFQRRRDRWLPHLFRRN